MRTNQDFAKSLKTPAANFFLCDFHVHSPGSADTRIGERFAALSKDEQSWIPRLDALPNDLAAHDKQMISDCPVDSFYKLLLERRNQIVDSEAVSVGNDWAFVAVTDHNVAEYAAALSRHAWEKRKESRLVILPGIELDVKFSVEDVTNNNESDCTIHLLCIFPPQTDSSSIRLAIAKASETSWSFGSGITVDSLPAFVDAMRTHESYPAICIAAHVASSKGLQSELRRSLLSNLDAAIARTAGELESGLSDTSELEQRLKELQAIQEAGDAANDQVLRHIGNCGLDALQVRDKQDEKHYRRLHRFRSERGRAVPITSSDAHSAANVFCNDDAITFLKLSGVSSSISPQNLFKEIRDRGLRYGDTRFSHSSPGFVSKWIAGIEVVPDSQDAEQFWPFTDVEAGSSDKAFVLPLSRNLNCLIGGRGSGKSATLDAVAFVAKPSDFNNKGKVRDDQRPEWYRRAEATLRGCIVRTCWKSTGDGDFSHLSKNMVFQSRFFDPKHNHADVKVTDIEGKEVLGGAIPSLTVSLFRIQEIEEAAQPDRLRDLFDRIHGEEISALNHEIESIRTRLAAQRAGMLTVANSISKLTSERAPLREFIKRKLQFLEVDKAEVRQKYEEIDAVGSAEAIATTAVKAWSQVLAILATDELKESVNSFFSVLAKKLKTEDGVIRKHCEQLQVLVDETGEDSWRNRVSQAIVAAESEMRAFAGDLAEAANAISETHKTARDELERVGLPTGGKDREAKKKAYEDAEQALGNYRDLCSQWGDLFTERKKLHDQLVGKCIARTKLRGETAETLTTKLATDLDSSILRIEADARPMSDKTEFLEWLQKNLAPSSNFRYRLSRIQAIVDKGVMPAELRNLLISEDGSDNELLLVDKAKAEDGKISAEDSKRFIEETFGRYRCLPEKADDELPEEQWNQLPVEVQEGLWHFPLDETKQSAVKVDAVLQLDEIVFDDMPELRLNDRPQDQGSKARPLSELSRGQRCSAILPILLLTGDAPLLIDQPEDNLDNRLIRQVVVNILAAMKLRRQVIIATHNPNLPVLGDAEQAVILRAVRERGCTLDACGHLDSSEVVKYVTDVMEGGREAFQYRQSIYQSHWDGPIEAT